MHATLNVLNIRLKYKCFIDQIVMCIHGVATCGDASKFINFVQMDLHLDFLIIIRQMKTVKHDFELL